MHKPIDLIEAKTQALTGRVETVFYALGGLFAQYSANPNTRALRGFLVEADNMLEAALEDSSVALVDAVEDVLKASLSAPELTFFETYDDSADYYLSARDALWGAFQQVRMHYARALRAMIVANTGQPNTLTLPKIMTRNGKKWEFREYTYLTVRSLLITDYNEVKIAYLKSIGATEFTVDTAKPELFYETFPISDYPNIAEKLFHPRSINLVGENINVST